MSTYQALGQLPWTNVELIDALDEFAQLYAQRPVIDNSGGMKSPHLFCAWFVMKKLQPKVIIESGVWWGQGTWFFEKACPQAEIHCIDPNLAQIRYRSPNATYYCRDFSDIDWRGIPADETVLFFDDHQNAYTRLQIARWLGFRHLIFEDNYPASRGDCYSLKKAFEGVGFTPVVAPNTSLFHAIMDFAKGFLGGPSQTAISEDARSAVAPNDRDAHYLFRNLAVYCEMPPVFKVSKTRWDDSWDDRYPTPAPLLDAVEQPWQQVYFDDADSYTWLCYAQLK